MRKHWQCSSRGARPQVLSLWCPFFMISLKLRGSLLNRCPLCSRPVAKFSITISLLSHLQLKPTTMSRDMKLLWIASEILKKCVIYFPPLLLPETGHFSKGQSRSRHDLLMNLLVSDGILIVIHLFLPKVNHYIFKFKFIKAPAQAICVQDLCNHINAFLDA